MVLAMGLQGGDLMRIFPVMTAVLPIVVGACAASTGVLPAGPDTYTITEKFSPLRGGSTEAKRAALTKASDFCAEKGRVFAPSIMREGGYNPQYGNTGYMVTFRCLPPNDPSVARNRAEAAPGIIGQRNP
jgi:hypothetical protein